MPRVDAFTDVEGIPHTRKLEEDMGVYDGGCKCQTRWVIYVEDGEILEKWENYYDSSSPSFLRSVRDKRIASHFVERNGIWYERVSANNIVGIDGILYDENEADIIEENGDRLYKRQVFKGGCKKPPEGIRSLEEILHDEDQTKIGEEEVFFNETCQVYGETEIENVLEVNISELPDGIYELIMEQGCWSSYSWYFGCHEGDSDAKAKLYMSVSIQSKEYYDEVLKETESVA